MVEQVVGVYPKGVAVHPSLVGDLGVQTEGDVDVPVVLDFAEQGRRSGIVGDHHVGVRQWVVAIDVEGVLCDLLESEHQERVQMDALIR